MTQHAGVPSSPSSLPGSPDTGQRIAGLAGAGITGRIIAGHLAATGWRVAVFDTRHHAARQTAAAVGGATVDSPAALAAADAVVLCHPGGHAELAESLITAGASKIVSVADALADVDALLALDAHARRAGATLITGAGMSPGLSGLLARSLAPSLDSLEEIHVAAHGTGGPACARRHHDALGDPALAWYDGAWLERFGGSGRELCWFPEPVGARDCYRAQLADPRLLHRAFPQAMRVSARVSATRRDRLTARLPMLTPPHSGGDVGAVRVEVRGADAGGARETLILGAAGRVAELAGATAAATAQWLATTAVTPGVFGLADEAVDAAAVLANGQALGVRLQEFTGVARATAW